MNMKMIHVMEYDEQLKMYKDFKACLMHLDYESVEMQSSFRKLRHHLDQIIVQLEKDVQNSKKL